MKNYLFLFLLLALVIAGAIQLLSASAGMEETVLRWMIFAYFAVITLSFHAGLIRTTRSKPAVFIRYYMASTTIRLFMHLGIIVMYCLFHRVMAVPFIVNFMIFYFIFTVFEVAMVFKVKNKK